ncbi:MAG: hypothetical protein IJZ20_00895 [Clostridia bacterium]|nr:hypothetical protein [Clostridia bacterium]
MNQNTKELILNHLKVYPKAEAQDIFKFLYQSTYGCEHMISSPDTVTEYIKKEANGLTFNEGILTEPLDGEFYRVHLSYLNKGLSAETLGKLFYLSAGRKNADGASLDDRLATVRELAADGKLPFSAEQLEEAIEKWRKTGFSPVHHSDSFRENYKPA